MTRLDDVPQRIGSACIGVRVGADLGVLRARWSMATSIAITRGCGSR